MKVEEAQFCAECSQLEPIGVTACTACTCTSFLYLSSFVNPQKIKNEVFQKFMEKEKAAGV